jgi:hypothetical protein
MKTVGFTSIVVAIFFGLFSCDGSDEINAQSTEKSISEESQNDDQQQSIKYDFTDFLNEILIGYEISAIHKYMIHTPFESLGEDRGRFNFEGIDENKVNHFVSFESHYENIMNAFVYNLDFKNDNSNLVMDYQKKIQNQLQEVYGDDFETGYDDFGFYIVDWYFEAGSLIFTTGMDFISVEIKEH